MDAPHDKPGWSLPYVSVEPADPRRRLAARIARIAAYILVAAMLAAPVIQFQHGTAKRYSQNAAPDADTKGAMARWQPAFWEFWQGRNIYRDAGDDEIPGTARLHPNMPFTVILLSPLAYLSAPVMALVLNFAKVLAILASLLMAAALAAHGDRRIPDWILGLGFLWAALPIIGDIQHGNTNAFVLLTVVLHLWLFRRGRELASGLALALAVCLKMTPALFALYWLYQRGWKVLAGLAAGLVLAVAIIPAAAVGPQRAVLLTRTWLDNLIVPGLIKGSWYPIHVNQSLPGVACRYFLGKPNPNGDAFWNPDDYAYGDQPESGWIAPVSLPEPVAKNIVRGGQLAILFLLAWTIGWRSLPRDDGRRALHYGLVAVAILLMNQRTWDHHATILLLTDVAIWQGIAYGRMSRRRRATALGLCFAAGLCLWLSRSEIVKLAARCVGQARQGEHWKNILEAYGPVFFHFVLLLAAGVLVARALKKLPLPYAEKRQTLGKQPPDTASR